MTKENETRSYPMSDADLGKTAMGLATTIKRDATDFATRNITATEVASFENMADDFNNTPTDEELVGELKDATDTKNKTMNDIKVAIRPIRNMADLAFKGKGKYSSFAFKDMDSMNDFETFKLATRVVRVGNKHLAELTSQGLTQSQLTALQTLANLLFGQMEVAEDKAENRDIETQNRVQKGNTLWDKMVTLASIGKSLYADTNPAKYNDYVLITTPPPPANPIETPKA